MNGRQGQILLAGAMLWGGAAVMAHAALGPVAAGLVLITGGLVQAA